MESHQFQVYCSVYLHLASSYCSEDNDHRASETHTPPDLGFDDSRSAIVPEQAEPWESDDFDERAADFWAIYAKDARSNDEITTERLKEDMDGILIFVCFQSSMHACSNSLMCCPYQAGLYSAILAAFITESQKSLTPDPSDEIAYYARQTVVLLAQISAQLAASGSPAPSTVIFPPAFPEFHAAKSDVRVNIYWFMSLVLSLSAALGATLVQYWAREYLQSAQGYDHPLKRAYDSSYMRASIDGAWTSWYTSSQRSSTYPFSCFSSEWRIPCSKSMSPRRQPRQY